MQIDMHYYGTWAMARAAGLTGEAATAIATAAQYVDDNVANGPLVLKDGARLLRRATAHHMDDIENVYENDQREVWVPFHFLPAIQPSASGDRDYTELLRCGRDSDTARAMVLEMLGRAGSDPLILERAGITAHVYADTFSHHGFSGVSSRRNRVDGDSFTFDHDDALAAKLTAMFKDFGGRFRRLFANIKPWLVHEAAQVQSAAAEALSGALGHGAVATYPDLPYLRWSFRYEFPPGKPCPRDNPADCLAGARALHAMFQKLAQSTAHDAKDGVPFDAIEPVVRRILAVVGDKDERAAAWMAAVKSGELPGGAIPPYGGQQWTEWLSTAARTITSAEALANPACRFHLAANAHRSWVLHELLPSGHLLVA